MDRSCKEEALGLGMKMGISSDWDIEAFLAHEETPPPVSNNKSSRDASGFNQHPQILFRPSVGCCNPTFGLLSNQLDKTKLVGHVALDVSAVEFDPGRQGSAAGIGHDHKFDMPWPESVTPLKYSTISPTMESQSSLCAGSPTSATKPGTKSRDVQIPGGTSCSEQSDDDESVDIEAWQCEQSADVVDLKRMRRMVSNRESARRSRRRKQAHLADLELQVDQLRGENAHLYKQLTEANQQFSEAATDNRVLKSDVEALRMKVKMAEDLVTRGSLACSLNHLLQSHAISPQPMTARNICRLAEATLDLEVNPDPSHFIGMPITGQQVNTNTNTIPSNMTATPEQGSLPRIENLDLHNKIPSNETSRVSDVWPWESTIVPVSKQL